MKSAQIPLDWCCVVRRARGVNAFLKFRLSAFNLSAESIRMVFVGSLVLQFIDQPIQLSNALRAMHGVVCQFKVVVTRS